MGGGAPPPPPPPGVKGAPRGRRRGGRRRRARRCCGKCAFGRSSCGRVTSSWLCACPLLSSTRSTPPRRALLPPTCQRRLRVCGGASCFGASCPGRRSRAGGQQCCRGWGRGRGRCDIMVEVRSRPPLPAAGRASLGRRWAQCTRLSQASTACRVPARCSCWPWQSCSTRRATSSGIWVSICCWRHSVRGHLRPLAVAAATAATAGAGAGQRPDSTPAWRSDHTGLAGWLFAAFTPTQRADGHGHACH
eukprot:COSAG01_NODE_5336_length_4326_cov_2.410457_3_plen_248_part_00